MAEGLKNIAASVKGRLLARSRASGESFELLLVRFALERVLYRLSVSPHCDRFILKGGMLVAQWLEHGQRETRDMDFLGHGDGSADGIAGTFREILSAKAEDGLLFDLEAMTASPIREEMEYGGIRLKTVAMLERTRIPVTLDIGFGDQLASPARSMAYPSMLGMEEPIIRCYPPEAVLAEKFQAVVVLGLANGRMKDFYDLWTLPHAVPIDEAALAAAIRLTFANRETAIPQERPTGLSAAMYTDAAACLRWRAYLNSLGQPDVAFETVIEAIWTVMGPICARLNGE